MDDEQPVEQIGRYVVVARIGSGGFATVYRVRDSNLGREVALKVMRPLLLSDPSFVKRFEQEARVVANLDHPHIVPIYDYGDIEDRLCLVMKLLPGGSLGDVIRKGPLPWSRIVALTGQVAAALDYAHERGLVHRDIKPENVLLDDEGNAVLADFGLVRALESGRLTTSLSGGVLGTPAYVAPEVWNGEAGTRSTDVYGLACLVYEMITGAQLFDAPTPPATMTLHFRPPQFPAQWPEGTPPGIERVLRQALAHEPDARYASAGAFAAALAGLKEDPLAAPYAALEAAVAAEKWNDAVALGETIVGRAPGYREARALLAQATEARLEAENAAWAAQWQAETESALGAGDWERALTAAQRWQGFAPEDEAAAAALARAQAMRDAAAAPAEEEAELGVAETVIEAVPEVAPEPERVEEAEPEAEMPQVGAAEEKSRQDAGAPVGEGADLTRRHDAGVAARRKSLTGYRWREIEEAPVETAPAAAAARPFSERLRRVPWWAWAVLGVVVVVVVVLALPGPDDGEPAEEEEAVAEVVEEPLLEQTYDNEQLGLSFAYPAGWELAPAGEVEPFQVAVASEEWIAAQESGDTAGAAVAFKVEDADDLGEGPLDELLREHGLYADMTADGNVTTEPEMTTVNGLEAAMATVETPVGESGDTTGLFSLLLIRFEERYLLTAVATTLEGMDAQRLWLEGIVNSATLRPPAPLVAEGSVGAGEMVAGDVEPIMRQAWTLHGSAGETFHIVVAPDEAFDVMVDVVDGDGDSILDEGEVDSASSGDAEAVTVTLPEDGDYLIVVRGYQNSSGGYTVEVNYHDGGPQDGVSQELPPFAPLSLVNPAGCGGSSRIERVYAWDRYGVDFVLCESDAAFLTKLAMPAFGIASDEQLNATGGTGDLLTAPMGTGPFYVQEWNEGDQVVFGRHDTYWDELAHVETLIFRFTEAAGRLEALQSGEADGIDEPDNTDAVIHDAALQLIGRPPSSTAILTLNSRFAPLDDARVRQAIALGIDRARIVDVYGGANTTPASHITPCEYEAGCGGEPFESDPDKGRELLAEAGYPDGLTVSLIVAEEVYHAESWHNVVRDELSSNLGIEVIVETLPWEELLAGYQAGELPGLSLMAWVPTYPHTAGQLDAIFRAEPNSTDFPQIVSALRAAEQASAAEKDERFGEVNTLIRELVPVVPLFHVGSTVAYRADVEGAHGSVAGAEEFSWMDPGGRDVLVWMQNEEPSTLYCADAGDWDDLRACSQVMETLITFDGPGPAIRPGLAHSWDVSEDRLLWTFYLREGVTFHDGTLFDANDVVLTFAAALDPNHPLHTGNSGEFVYYEQIWGLFEGAAQQQ